MVVRTLLRAVPSRMAECADSLPKPNDYLMINGYRFVSVFLVMEAVCSFGVWLACRLAA